MMYRLIILTGPSTGLRVTIESKPMVIGRDPDCAVRVADEEVARKHAVIEHRADGIYIRDLGSMNRILVNQHEVRETRLKHGDVIELGLTRFLVQALVQADVTDEEHMEKRARKAALASVAAALLLLIAVAAGVGTLIRKADTATAVAPPDVGETIVAVETAQPPVTIRPVETEKQEPSGLRESLQPMSDELRLVREDLADLRATMKSLSVQPAPPPPAPAAAPLQPEKGKPAWAPSSALRAIKIVSVDQQKFPASDEFDEMRMLNVALTSDIPPEEIDPSAVHVEISFFDEGPSNQVGLTRAIAPKEPLAPDGNWGLDEQKIVTATYVVPPGFRKGEAGGTRRYYGYRVRVFYHNELQDAEARPKALLNGVGGSVSGATNLPDPDAAGTGSS